MVIVKGRSVRIFAEANTADGFRSYVNSVVSGLKKIYILVGGAHIAISKFLRTLADDLLDKGVSVELIMCGVDHHLVDGVIIEPLKIAFVNGAYPHKFETRYPGVVEEIINLGECWDKELLEQKGNDIINLTNKALATMDKGYRYLKTAREIHNHWEKLYVQGLNYSKANEKTEKVLVDIFQNTKPRVRHLFMSSINYDGPVNFIEENTQECTKRFILKGQPGTGKATLIEKVVKEATARNLDVDIYHCALDPEKIDMVILPQLKIAVIHGTRPHEVEPTRIGDVVVDMLECVDDGVVKNITSEANRLEEEYELTQSQAIRTFNEARGLYKELDQIYMDIIQKELLENIEETLKNIVKEELEKFNNNSNL